MYGYIRDLLVSLVMGLALLLIFWCIQRLKMLKSGIHVVNKMVGNMYSAFGKIVDGEKLDKKSGTKLSDDNKNMATNSPTDSPYIHRSGVFLSPAIMARLRHVAWVENSRVKRREQLKPLDLTLFRGWCGGL
jgi:hypothetical protein